MIDLIAVTGYKNSGKNAVCNVLRDEFGYKITGFADVLKSMMLAIDPIIYFSVDHPYRVSDIVAEIGWDEAKEKYPEIRRLLQRLGTEGGRKHLGEDVWINAWSKTASQLLEAGYGVCVCDMRFLNEAAAVKDLGGKIIRVWRPGTAAGEHASENELDRILQDWTVFNDGPLDELSIVVKKLVSR